MDALARNDIIKVFILKSGASSWYVEMDSIKCTLLVECVCIELRLPQLA